MRSPVKEFYAPVVEVDSEEDEVDEMLSSINFHW